MDFLDELDNAFDNLMIDSEGDDEDSSQDPSQSPSFDETRAEVNLLTSAIAEEVLVPVRGVLALVDRYKRAYVVAAVVGSLHYLQKVDQDPTRAKANEELTRLLRTRRGSIRKVLRAEEKDRLPGLAQVFGHNQDASQTEHIASFLKALQSFPELNEEDCFLFFKAGVWSLAFFREARVAELALLSQVEAPKVARLKEHAEAIQADF